MADRITIEKGRVLLTSEEGQEVELPEPELLAMLRRHNTAPLDGASLPDGIKFIPEWRDPFMLVVHQMPPHVRQFRWIADGSPVGFGRGTKYRKVRLSIPYAVTFATYFRHGTSWTLTESNELYFRNQPLRDTNDRLGFPALLNISRIDTPKRSRSWICTQHLDRSACSDWTVQLDALLSHIWNGTFNLSSEFHEGSSWYLESRAIHKDLYPVEKWEQATAANETFALSVPWKQAPLTVGDLIDCMFDELTCDTHARRSPLKPAANRPASLFTRIWSHAQKQKPNGK